MQNYDTVQDEEIEWWRPTQQDNYDLTQKLMRTGCRPTQRQYLNCIRNENDEQFKKCSIIKEDLEKCLNLAQYVYATRQNRQQI